MDLNPVLLPTLFKEKSQLKLYHGLRSKYHDLQVAKNCIIFRSQRLAPRRLQTNTVGRVGPGRDGRDSTSFSVAPYHYKDEGMLSYRKFRLAAAPQEVQQNLPL